MEKLRPARWRLWQSAGYGLVFGAVVGGLTVATSLASRWSAEFVVGTVGGAGWNSLILAMADSGERLTGLHGYCVWTARVGRSGLLKLMEDYATHPFLKTGDCPMPWEPVDMGEIIASLAGAPDMIAVRDKVT
jgi:hypothetical protein